ncbi:MAG: hypothetical protein AAF310_00685 [Myxococcota bacterium]
MVACCMVSLQLRGDVHVRVVNHLSILYDNHIINASVQPVAW